MVPCNAGTAPSLRLLVFLYDNFACLRHSPTLEYEIFIFHKHRCCWLVPTSTTTKPTTEKVVFGKMKSLYCQRYDDEVEKHYRLECFHRQFLLRYSAMECNWRAAGCTKREAISRGAIFLLPSLHAFFVCVG